MYVNVRWIQNVDELLHPTQQIDVINHPCLSNLNNVSETNWPQRRASEILLDILKICKSLVGIIDDTRNLDRL